MIEHHAAIARLARGAARAADAVLESLDVGVRAVGRSRAGPVGSAERTSRSRRESHSSPSTSRSPIASAGSSAAGRLARSEAASSSTRRSRRSSARTASAVRRARFDLDLGRRDRRRARARDHPLATSEFDRALEAIANFVDLKSPYTLGHSRAVADLAAEAGAPARAATRGRSARSAARRSSHDLGRLGVSNAIWDKPGPLGAGEWERVRLHPYLTERMLQQSAALAPLGAIAVQHHERLDGSGYPRGLPGAAISRPARILGAADAYQAMREPRPHRPALDADEAAAELRADVDGRAPRRRRRRGGARRGRTPRRAPARGPGRADRPRGRGAAARRPRDVEQGDRRAAGDLAEDRREPHRAHLRQDRRLEPRRAPACSPSSTASSPRRRSRRPDAKIGRSPDCGARSARLASVDTTKEATMLKLSKDAPVEDHGIVQVQTAEATDTPRTSSPSRRRSITGPCSRAFPTTAANARTGDTCSRAR